MREVNRLREGAALCGAALLGQGLFDLDDGSR